MGWKGKNKRIVIFKVDFIFKKYLILERRENNFINKMYYENGIIIIYRIFFCIKFYIKYVVYIFIFLW